MRQGADCPGPALEQSAASGVEISLLSNMTLKRSPGEVQMDLLAPPLLTPLLFAPQVDGGGCQGWVLSVGVCLGGQSPSVYPSLLLSSPRRPLQLSLRGTQVSLDSFPQLTTVVQSQTSVYENAAGSCCLSLRGWVGWEELSNSLMHRQRRWRVNGIQMCPPARGFSFRRDFPRSFPRFCCRGFSHDVQPPGCPPAPSHQHWLPRGGRYGQNTA